jgi:hypothetical protein
MARYVIQFNAFIPKIGSKIFTKEFVDGFDLYAAGLQKYHHPKLLFVYLLALSVLALMLLLEVKIISSKLKDDGMKALWDKDEDEEEEKKEDEDTKSASVQRLTTTALLSSTPVRKGHVAKRHAYFNEEYKDDDRLEKITIRVNVRIVFSPLENTLDHLQKYLSCSKHRYQFKMTDAERCVSTTFTTYPVLRQN